jgi:hypothetical protein
MIVLAIIFLLLKPPQFEPGLNTVIGRDVAGKACMRAAENQIMRSGFDHSNYLNVQEIGRAMPATRYPREHQYSAGRLIGGRRAERYAYHSYVFLIGRSGNAV